VSEQQRELERLRAKVKPVIQSWIDNVIVPSLIAEWLARDESAKSRWFQPRRSRDPTPLRSIRQVFH